MENHFNLGFVGLGEFVHGHRAIVNMKHSCALHVYLATDNH